MVLWSAWRSQLNNPQGLLARQAIESLRAGVPNATAVDALGIDQPAILKTFSLRLEILQSRSHEQIPGFIIEGGFGSGKSHVLKFLSNVASKRGLASSTVVVSKETPLSDLSTVYRSAISNLEFSDGRVGGSLAEIFYRLDNRSAQYKTFLDDVRSVESELDPLFHASLLLFERYRADLEIVEKLVDFWDGGKAQITEWKRLLRDLEFGYPTIKTVSEKQLSAERFTFATLAMRAAGVKGWIIAIDEIELVAKFSLRSRGLAYGTLGKLLGVTKSRGKSALRLIDTIVVGAITPDLIGELFRTRDDRNELLRRYEHDAEYLEAAFVGIDSLTTMEAVQPIAESNDEQLHHVNESVRRLYRSAYPEHDIPDELPAGISAASAGRSMRQSIRGWIAYWDLKRADPVYEPSIVADLVHYDLSEDAKLEMAAIDE